MSLSRPDHPLMPLMSRRSMLPAGSPGLSGLGMNYFVLLMGIRRGLWLINTASFHARSKGACLDCRKTTGWKPVPRFFPTVCLATILGILCSAPTVGRAAEEPENGEARITF